MVLVGGGFCGGVGGWEGLEVEGWGGERGGGRVACKKEENTEGCVYGGKNAPKGWGR